MGTKELQMTLLFKKVLLHFLFQLICLCGISIISHYKFPDLSETNWDIALFLTPIGMLKNSLDSSPVMRSFYNDFSTGQIELAEWQIVLISLLLIVQIYNFTKLVRVINQ